MALPKLCIDCDVKLTRQNRASVVQRSPGHEDLCNDCYEQSGMENEHNDGHHKPGEYPESCPLCGDFAKEEQAKARAKADDALARARAAAPKKIAAAKPSGMEVSKEKARKLLEHGKEFGWEIDTFTERDDEFWIKVARPANGETIVAGWENGVWIHPCRYECGGRSIRLLNASAARKRMASEPDLVLPKRSARADANGNSKERAARIIAKRIPFDPDKANAAEILAAVSGKRLVWRNSLTRGLESAMVKKPRQRERETDEQFQARCKRALRMETGQAGRPIIAFIGVNGKEQIFRAVAVEAIVQVR